MVERISTATRYARLVADMQTNMYNYNKLALQLSSGKKYTNITDNPIASVNILNTNRQLGQIETFEQNVGMASAELSALDDLMDLATGYLSKAWDKAVQANTQTYGDSSLKALKVEIDEITKTMVDLANTEYNDNYIFSGANTKVVPYEIDNDGNIIYNGTKYDNPDYIRQTEVADGVFETINTTGDKVFGYYSNKDVTRDANGYEVVKGADGKYYYKNKTPCPVGTALTTTLTDYDGKVVTQNATDRKYYYADGTEYTGKVDNLQKTIKDNDGNLVTQNADGTYSWVKGKQVDPAMALTTQKEEEAAGVLGALKKLSNSIQKVLDGHANSNDTMAQEGYTEMNSTLDMFANAMNTITTEQTKFGGVANRMEMSESTLETNSENLISYLSDIQSVDYAEAITNWLNAQYAYQASLQVSSASMNLSLLNYLQ